MPQFKRPTNSTGAVDFFLRYPDDLLGGGFEWLLVGVVFSVVLVGSLRFGFRRALATAGFVSMLLSVILLWLGVAGNGIVIVTAIITVTAALLNRERGVR